MPQWVRYGGSGELTAVVGAVGGVPARRVVMLAAAVVVMIAAVLLLSLRSPPARTASDSAMGSVAEQLADRAVAAATTARPVEASAAPAVSASAPPPAPAASSAAPVVKAVGTGKPKRKGYQKFDR